MVNMFFGFFREGKKKSHKSFFKIFKKINSSFCLLLPLIPKHEKLSIKKTCLISFSNLVAGNKNKKRSRFRI